jgi:hypothetical protein
MAPPMISCCVNNKVSIVFDSINVSYVHPHMSHYGTKIPLIFFFVPVKKLIEDERGLGFSHSTLTCTSNERHIYHHSH